MTTTTWPAAALGDVAEVNPRLTTRLNPDDRVTFVPMAAVDATRGGVESPEERLVSELTSGLTPFKSGDVLVAKITPCFENGKIAQAITDTEVAYGSTEFHVVRAKPDTAHQRYLFHYLRQQSVRSAGERRMTGSAGQRRVPEAFLRELKVPLPPLDEQRRIAGILDAADEVRAKRHESLALLDSLTEAIFLDMFGDPMANPMNWPVVRFGDLLSGSLRNGVSPSASGSIEAQVLTLSAITGRRFAAEAVKSAHFAVSPPEDKRVRHDDFLICRGNGNLNLVGRGRRPRVSMPQVAFPDTAIAARPDSGRLVPDYLECIWHMPIVRRQLESMARTTNGTYKINQGMIETVEILVPPIDRQLSFASAVSGLRAFELALEGSESQLDELFASIQHRAFKGEL